MESCLRWLPEGPQQRRAARKEKQLIKYLLVTPQQASVKAQQKDENQEEPVGVGGKGKREEWV